MVAPTTAAISTVLFTTKKAVLVAPNWSSTPTSIPSSVKLASQPGVIVHGLGHLYAGDDQTFGRLSNLGQLGYVLTVVGGGLAVGGYYLDEDDTELLGQDLTDPTAYSLYAAGGVAGGIGLAYFFTAWFYDMIDTTGASRSRWTSSHQGRQGIHWRY